METKDFTRIYVFLGEGEMLYRFMKQMRVEQMFSEGKYMVVYLSPKTAVYDEFGYYLWNKDGEVGGRPFFPAVRHLGRLPGIQARP